MSKEIKARKEYMRPKDVAAMGHLPRSHENCLTKTGVMRPGKTAQDRARRSHAG